MEAKEFIKNFIEQFEDADTEKITLNTQFRDIEGWSSLIALSVIAMVDEVYSVKLTGDDIRRSQTINDIFNIVKTKL